MPIGVPGRGDTVPADLWGGARTAFICGADGDAASVTEPEVGLAGVGLWEGRDWCAGALPAWRCSGQQGCCLTPGSRWSGVRGAACRRFWGLGVLGSSADLQRRQVLCRSVAHRSCLWRSSFFEPGGREL